MSLSLSKSLLSLGKTSLSISKCNDAVDGEALLLNQRLKDRLQRDDRLEGAFPADANEDLCVRELCKFCNQGQGWTVAPKEHVVHRK